MYNVHDVLRRVIFYCIWKHNNFKQSTFGYDLKLLSFLKMKHKTYKESIYFQIFIFIKKYKKNVIYLNNYIIFHNNLHNFF
jgi:hypothetical protein